MTLKPFFSFFGGKWRAAKSYPPPLHDTIIEPFAGSAGYSLRYPDKNIILYEKDEVIYKVWDFLINASEEDVRNLPILEEGESLDDYDLSEGEKFLIGFWLNKGTTQPAKKPSKWARKPGNPGGFWSERYRERIASQLRYIRHWKVFNLSYEKCPDMEATWFIDPPYQYSGHHYKKGSKCIEYDNLAEWCLCRRGQVIVCEQEGADWLPFEPLGSKKSTPGSRGKGYSKELIYHFLRT